MNPQDDASRDQQPDKKFVPLEAIARVQYENGRWVVYLNVPSWDPEDAEPVTNHWKRIHDYSRKSDAKVAASWYERSANKTFRPPLGF